jgi:hypothetical protein
LGAIGAFNSLQSDTSLVAWIRTVALTPRGVTFTIGTTDSTVTIGGVMGEATGGGTATEWLFVA